MTGIPIDDRDPDALDPHPKNDEVYGEDDDLPPDFVASVREHGVREPLVVTPEDRIVSGHRRWRAARAVGLDSVPVRVREFEDELAEWVAIVDYNRQRRKTPAQIVNEAELLMEIEERRARERQGTRTDLDADDDDGGGATSGSNEPEVREDPTRARDAVGEQLGVGGSTIEKGRRVKAQAEQGDETAREQWERMHEGDQSIHGAYEAIREADDDADDADEPLGPPTHECVVCGEEWAEYEAALDDAAGESIPVEKVCVVEWPDVVIHVPEGVL